MIFKSPVILSTVAALALTACVAPEYNAADPNARARNGAIIGGISGAIIGATQSDEELTGAIAGGILGAAAGGAIGATLDQQAAELRNSIGNANVTVTNRGDYLVVNMPQDLLFATDSASLRPDLARDIQAVGQNLLRYPNSRVEVVGHADNSGSAAYNQDLSQRRAVAVADNLRAVGVPSSRITAFGRGEDQPIASNLSPEGRAANRRVEIIIRPTT
ncbi:MAG: OmpA family protein [Rhodobacteraceae bacterium]|jgi:outer membrane protein OmpA-like peptidoglycan-associated protein|nr:OmpA family protein [Paracoccaceae bacterium]